VLGFEVMTLKMKLLFLAGVLLIAEGYFWLIRGILPVSFEETDPDREYVYVKVSNTEAAFNYDLILYLLGLVLIIISLYATYVRKSKN
jgi:hypothetical protein